MTPISREWRTFSAILRPILQKIKENLPQNTPYFCDFEDTFSIHPLQQGIEDLFSEKVVTLFYHFKDAFEFYPYFTGK